MIGRSLLYKGKWISSMCSVKTEKKNRILDFYLLIVSQVNTLP